ncbi:hypothetical protein E0I61_03890 [Flavobacterium ranwuense]|uniref:Uncharacterized protein n=1 Tax=Flavobacterium ranwuense TaxID=2541725 RepID=A0ABY2DWV7_9FLAO|nr:hypothetical protein [Flavobacterium ranwuense]TDE31855.1 hypothetical protein E0I61_03890 [Flavobacterium ranwuense]
MKNLWIITILISTICYSQKTYFFDCKIDYEFTNHLDSTKNCIKTYYVNSKDNTYFVYRIAIDNATSKIEFIDRNGAYLLKKINNKIFNNKIIYINKYDVKHYSYPFKYQLNNYNFSGINDTVLNSKVYKQISFLSNDLKRTRKKKLGTLMYILDTNFDHQPLLEFSTAFEVWKVNRKMPNGLIIESHLSDYENKLVFSEKLRQINSISMNLIIQE